MALCKKNIRIGLLDGDFQFGDVCLAMDLQATFSMKDIVEEAERLDEHTLASYLIHHDSGVKVLPAPDRPEYADLITPEVLERVIGLMIRQHDYLIADTGVGLQEHSLALMEQADQILIVTNLEMAAMKNTKGMLETLQALDLIDRVQIVINRANMESVISSSDAASILDVENPFYIPNDFAVVSQSINIGIPFVINQGKTEVAKAVYKMAEQLSSRREISMFKPKSPSFFSALFKKKVST